MAAIDDLQSEMRAQRIRDKFSEETRALFVLDELKRNPDLMKTERGRALISHCKKVLGGNIPDIWTEEPDAEFDKRMRNHFEKVEPNDV